MHIIAFDFVTWMQMLINPEFTSKYFRIVELIGEFFDQYMPETHFFSFISVKVFF